MFNTKFNTDLYINIRNMRKSPVDTTEIEHPLKGKKIIANDTRKEYIIENVFRQWHLGYYIILSLVDENKSHRMVMWQNINCHESIILNHIEDNKHIFQVIE